MGLDLGAILKTGALAVSNRDAVVSINIFIALLCSCIVIGHLLEGNRWVNESITALVMVGALLLQFMCLWLCFSEHWFEFFFFNHAVLMPVGSDHWRCDSFRH
jgi:hypothetical protein